MLNSIPQVRWEGSAEGRVFVYSIMTPATYYCSDWLAQRRFLPPLLSLLPVLQAYTPYYYVHIQGKDEALSSASGSDLVGN
jgi:hypothetical protein